MADPIQDFISEARARCEAAAEIPADARADWDGTNHWEIQSATHTDGFWWLILWDVFDGKDTDPSGTENGKRLGMMLDLACAARRDLPKALDALEAVMAGKSRDEVARILIGGDDA